MRYSTEKAVLEYHRKYPGLMWGEEYVDDEELLKIFEREHLPTLIDKIQQLQNFITPSNYWYTKEELNRLLHDYSSYLRINRRHLTKTGFPKTKFDRSEWIDFSFTNTYPTKLPANFYGDYMPGVWISNEYNGLVEKDSYDYPLYDYYWIEENILKEDMEELLHGDYEKNGKTQYKSFSECYDFKRADYDQAAYLYFLESNEIEIIESVREKLVDLKVQIIDYILYAIKKSKKDILEDVITLFTDYFTYEEFGSLLDIERKFVENKLDEYFIFFHEEAGLQYYSDEYKEEFDENAYVERPTFWNLLGGIRGIFYFVIYIEKELNVGRIDAVKRGFQEIFPGSENFNKRHKNNRAIGKLDNGNLIQSYYQIINTDKREDVDILLEKDKMLLKKEREFWKEQSLRTVRLLDDNLKQEYYIPVKIKKKYEQKYFTYIEHFIKEKVEHLNINGELPDNKLHLKGHEIKENLFRKAGEGFEIMFNGKPSFFLKETVGLNYIYILMSNRNKAIPLQELVYFNKVSGSDRKSVEMYDGSISTEGSGTSKEYSKEDLKHVAQKLTELNEEKNEANELGNYEKAEELLYKIERLQEYIRDAQNRKQDPEIERMRTKVKNAITTAIQKVRMYDSELAQHFVEKINTGYTCMYSLSPSENIEWHFS